MAENTGQHLCSIEERTIRPADPVWTGDAGSVSPGCQQVVPITDWGLANWLTSPSNPLTARVAVNHYWQLCFGEGLVRTPEDFRQSGRAPPTHPELLDWLAVDFQDHGWDLKKAPQTNRHVQHLSSIDGLLQQNC